MPFNPDITHHYSHKDGSLVIIQMTITGDRLKFTQSPHGIWHNSQGEPILFVPTEIARYVAALES
jgi:hypothetical protein